MALRIHPAIGIARVGTSPDYYLAPETRAGAKQEGAVSGGLPIRPGTEAEPISSADLRDGAGALKRQGARFRIFAYPDDAPAQFPTGAGEEIVIGSVVEGKTVTDILWMAHLANKKANHWETPEVLGADAFKDGALPPLRNPGFAGSSDPADPARRAALVIDAGPRALSGKGSAASFDAASPASILEDGAIAAIDYPQQWPSGPFPDRAMPMGEDIDTLGDAFTDDKGRLIVVGAYGRSVGFDPSALPLKGFVNNNKWLDDTADGPVHAVVVFDDGSSVALEPAWVVSTDPAYAPQTLNVVSLWDEQYEVFLQHFGLNPAIWSDGAYRPDYAPDFGAEIAPVFDAAALQMWTTNLPSHAIAAHRSVGMISAEDDPQSRIYLKMLIRDPDSKEDAKTGAPLMPLALGDVGKPFMSVTSTQYFFLNQWFDGKYRKAPERQPGPGEALDIVSMANCLGGRFGPGIDMTFVVRDPSLYAANWAAPEIGPFRIKAAPIDYRAAAAPALGVGYVPFREGQPGAEPGDMCKFMAVPWHADYNSCATHTPSPNPGGSVHSPDGEGLFDGRNLNLFWSWPAQRPVAVYTFDDLIANEGTLPEQRFSVRGAGTEATANWAGAFPAQNVGRYQDAGQMLTEWHKIGMVIQGSAIEGYPEDFDPDYYLEVASQLDDGGDPVSPWPNTIVDDPKA